MAGDDSWLSELPALVRAAAIGDRTNAARLVAEGVDPNQADDDGWSALHAAATFDHPEIVALLLEAGAAIDARTEDGLTPLLNAARASVATISTLLSAGADPNATNDLGWRPLHRFAEHGNLGAIELLLQAGVDVNERDAHGETALMHAAQHGESECVAILLTAGSDSRLVNKDGETAGRLARRWGHDGLAQRLADA